MPRRRGGKEEKKIITKNLPLGKMLCRWRNWLGWSPGSYILECNGGTERIRTAEPRFCRPVYWTTLARCHIGTAMCKVTIKISLRIANRNRINYIFLESYAQCKSACLCFFLQDQSIGMVQACFKAERWRVIAFHLLICLLSSSGILLPI